jgi:glycosyltransferase involved in cell wall biosynthesis
MRRRLGRRRSLRHAPRRVLVLIENVPFAVDHRARKQVGALLREGYHVGVVSRRHADNLAAPRPGLRVYQYPAPPERGGKLFFAFEYGYSLAAALLLVFRARIDGRFQLVQAGHPPDIYFAVALPARLLGARFVVDQRDLSPEVYAERFGRSDGAMLSMLRLLERWSCRAADAVITVNESLRSTIVSRDGVPASKVSVVGNGPELASVAAADADPELFGGAEHLVCWLGVMGPQDHVDLALEAAAHITHELGRRDVIFEFIGDGECLPGLRRRAVELGLSDVVRFTGWLDEQTYFRHLATATLALDSNLQEEVTPVKGLEYMAHSVPFVAFDLHETRALAGAAARYVVPGDTRAMAWEINRLLDAPAERLAMGSAGREAIEARLAWDRQERRYLEVIRSVAGTSDGAPASSRAITAMTAGGSDD